MAGGRQQMHSSGTPPTVYSVEKVHIDFAPFKWTINNVFRQTCDGHGEAVLREFSASGESWLLQPQPSRSFVAAVSGRATPVHQV